MTTGTSLEPVVFRFDRPKAGAVPDANGNLPTEEVDLVIPLTKIAPMPPALDLSGVADADLIRVYETYRRDPDDTMLADMLLPEIAKRGLAV